ncbi:MAG: PAS domain-containing protein, partial [Candidatus Heimdallarchaeota archaeon]|nr:PAS domain-containing protein [Candidatus Heimdallarchaeota archaeon]
MTAIDLLIIGMTTYALVIFYKHRKSLKYLNLYVGASFVLLGLTIIALFYLADLLTMFLLPIFIPMKVAMDIMRNLHLNYNWIVALCGVGLIISGFIYMTRILFPGIEKLLSDIEGSKEALVEDLVERKAAEEILKKTEERLNRAQEVGNVGTWDWNQITGELIWSDEIYRILGYSPNEVVPSYELFLERVHPDDTEFLNQSVEEALHEKKLYNLDCRVIAKNGLERIANARGEVIFDESGKPMQMLGTFQDITERKRIEEELRFYSEISMNMSDGINLARAADGVLL